MDYGTAQKKGIDFQGPVTEANLPRISCTRINKVLVRLIRGKSCRRPQHVGQDFPRGVLVLLCHKRWTAAPLLFSCVQQGQRRKVLAIATAMRLRMLAIESGQWR